MDLKCDTVEHNLYGVCEECYGEHSEHAHVLKTKFWNRA